MPKNNPDLRNMDKTRLGIPNVIECILYRIYTIEYGIQTSIIYIYIYIYVAFEVCSLIKGYWALWEEAPREPQRPRTAPSLPLEDCSEHLGLILPWPAVGGPRTRGVSKQVRGALIYIYICRMRHKVYGILYNYNIWYMEVSNNPGAVTYTPRFIVKAGRRTPLMCVLVMAP